MRSNKKKISTLLSAIFLLGNPYVERTYSTDVSVLKEPVSSAEIARNNRQWQGIFLGNISLFDTWVPPKFGISLGVASSDDFSLELEYLRGSISAGLFIADLGKMKEEKFTLINRLFPSQGSFNFLFGIGYQCFSLKLGNRLVSLASDRIPKNIDIVEVKTLGPMLGLGNRWQLGNHWVLGVDWFSFFLPIAAVRSEAPILGSDAGKSGKNEVEKLLNAVRKIPTFSLLKLQIGRSF